MLMPTPLRIKASAFLLALRQMTFNVLAKNIITALSNSQRIINKPAVRVPMKN
jgi:hypothetical protein